MAQVAPITDKAFLLVGMMLMFDNLDQVTRIDFTEEVINKKLDNATFNFEPPQGIDVIDDRG